MTWKNEKREELTDRSEFFIELARDPEVTPEEVGSDDRAVSTMMTSHVDGSVLIVEAGINQDGDGFVIAASFDEDGDRLMPSVLDLGDSLMIHATKTKIADSS